MSTTYLDSHRDLLDGALEALATRGFWSGYPEIPSGKIYGKTAKADGLATFEAMKNAPFALDLPGETGTIGGEVSPYGEELGVTYPAVDPVALLAGMASALPSWTGASIEDRVGVCLEILHRLNAQSFLIANAVMHTTGQGFMMAFQAGGPHAQDRGLEAVAWAYREMTACPSSATWRKQVGRDEFVTLEKTWRVTPRGIGVVVACSTFPTWNTYPGLFANLATGNGVIVKPHPGAILPVAITVRTCREVLAEAGFDPNIVTMAADTAQSPITKGLLSQPAVSIIDYTGSSDFGEWIETNATHAKVYTEKAGINSIVIDSIDDLRGVTGNIAFSLCLYSGQMCTTPQNIFIPEAGISTSEGTMSCDDVAGAIVKAVDWFLSDPGRASEVLGAIQSQATADRIDEIAASALTVLRGSDSPPNERYPDARVRSPLIIELSSNDHDVYGQELFGPIVCIIKTPSTKASIEIASEIARTKGAITAGVYSTDPATTAAASEALSNAGAFVSCNLTGQIWMNQAAAFSDFHVSGLNPAGNASLCDAAFIAGRFAFAQSRSIVPETATIQEDQAHAGV